MLSDPLQAQAPSGADDEAELLSGGHIAKVVALA